MQQRKIVEVERLKEVNFIKIKLNKKVGKIEKACTRREDFYARAAESVQGYTR